MNQFLGDSNFILCVNCEKFNKKYKVNEDHLVFLHSCGIKNVLSENKCFLCCENINKYTNYKNCYWCSENFKNKDKYELIKKGGG